VFGVLSLIWFLAWAFLISDSPDTHPTISREERDYIKRSIGKLSSIKPSLLSDFFDLTLFLSKVKWPFNYWIFSKAKKFSFYFRFNLKIYANFLRDFSLLS